MIYGYLKGSMNREIDSPNQSDSASLIGHRSAEYAAPIAYCGWHPKHGWALQTCGHNEQHCASLLMRTDIAGNHGWEVRPLYAEASAESGDRTEADANSVAR